MNLFDLHCDTIEELRDHGEDFAHHHRQFDIQDIQHCDGGVQTMAVFVPDHIRGQAAKDFVDDYYHYMNDAVSKVSHLAQMVEQVGDIQRITSEHKWAFLRSIGREALAWQHRYFFYKRLLLYYNRCLLCCHHNI